MRKEFVNYITDMCAFYRKHRSFIIKIMAIYTAICAAAGIIYMCRWKIYRLLVKSQEKLGDLIFGKHEIMKDAGGLAPEEEEQA